MERIGWNKDLYKDFYDYNDGFEIKNQNQKQGESWFDFIKEGSDCLLKNNTLKGISIFSVKKEIEGAN